MELPRKVLVGYDVILELGTFLKNLGFKKKVLFVSGENVREAIGSIVDKSLKIVDLSHEWSTVKSATMQYVNNVVRTIKEQQVDGLVGIGGGKSVDVAKLSAFYSGMNFVSVPTSASHDGISSPFATIIEPEKPYSSIALPPIGVLADINIISNAPKRLIASGCGDLLAKITSVKDWELAKEETNEYFGKYAASLAQLSANLVLKESKRIGNNEKDSIRDVVEALISAGVAAGIAGSSRPCSGSEHLFAHSLDLLSPGKSLHGERCGLGTILMSKVHGLPWKKIVTSLKEVHAPTTAKQLGIDSEIIIKAIVLAKNIRPDRYTILNKLDLNYKKAQKLAKSVDII
jgi:glycerol-1-phosphate dehydrogenase [NAD(P)+]